jgi:hypothetical protein
LGKPVVLQELIRPVKTRWNSYFAAFARAVKLQGPLNNYVKHKLSEGRHNKVIARRSRRPGGSDSVFQEPRLFLRKGGLNAGDWATITEYIRLLALFTEASNVRSNWAGTEI